MIIYWEIWNELAIKEIGTCSVYGLGITYVDKEPEIPNKESDCTQLSVMMVRISALNFNHIG